jgi:hypothetical protein
MLFQKEFLASPEPSELFAASKIWEELIGIGNPIKNIEPFSVTIIVFRAYYLLDGSAENGHGFVAVGTSKVPPHGRKASGTRLRS